MKNLTREQLKEQVIAMIKDRLRYDGEVTEEMNFVKDLRADSLDLVELVMAFEETYGVMVDDEAIGNIHTVKEVIDSLDTL